MAASAREQLQLELINEARLNPLASAARYITSYSPLTSNDPNIQNNFNFWHVDGATLQSAFNALQPVQPLAWNDSLANAARTHSTNMGSANQQTHTSLNGEAQGDTTTVNDDPDARMIANGYSSPNAWGENIAAKSPDDPLAILASFMVDWGSGPNGMQSPPGHRDNIMGIDDFFQNGVLQQIQSQFREVGVGIADVAVQSNVGPTAVTEDFASHGTAGAFVLGVAYNDTDTNKFYSIGEGLGTLSVSVPGATAVTTAAAGGYSVFTNTIGLQHLTFTGGGLASAVDFATTLTNNENAKIDIVNGNTLKTSVSGTITGPITRIEGLGILGLTLTAGAGTQTIVGTKGNDTIDGGAASDTVIFSGNKSVYTLTDLGGGSVKVAGPDGTDTLSNIETLQFADGPVTWPPAAPVAGSVSINDVSLIEGNSGTQTLTFTVTRIAGTAAFAVSYATANSTATTTDSDYVAAASTLSFGASVNTQTISVTINGDIKIEPDESFFVNLSSPTNGATISDGQGVGTITNDDVNHAPVITSDGGGDTAIKSIPENTTAVTMVTATDQDAGTAIMYSIVGGLDAAKFQVNATSGVLSFLKSPDFETPSDSDHNNSYIVQVGASDGSLVDGQTITVNVTNVIEQKTADDDFNGDGKADLLWQKTDGLPAIWYMDGTGVIGYGPNLPNPGGSWHAIAAADFNGNGKADILWQSDSGLPAVWLLNGTSAPQSGGLPNPGSGWHAKDAADFNGDGKADILWQSDDGLPAIWYMDGTNVAGYGPNFPDPGTPWHVTAAADFDGNGKADIVFQNDNGLPTVWVLDGSSVPQSAALPNPGSGWHLKEAADFNGDGKADILWQSDSGLAAIWYMNGANIAGYGPNLPNPGANWHEQGAVDANGDGKADIVWHSDNNLTSIWLMDATGMIGNLTNLPNTGAGWHLV